MHGRVKVRTTEEEKARKERDRQEKVKIFKHAMQKIQAKRAGSELDEELLALTGKVLTSNPDIYTLWNIRREILNIFRKTTENEDLSKYYDGELSLTEYCLKINPKSYCAWHQREWVLMSRSDPDWNKELVLCNMYLKLDERNFHTWDYRRFVVSQCKPPLQDEFDFTTEKLYDNFSNYSAWHYRSKLLVQLYPDLEEGRPIKDNHHKHELEMVQSAAFTDPDDTSAWFYQRWLLGAVKETTRIVVCTVTPLKCTVAFNKHVSQKYVISTTRIFFNGVQIDGDWLSCTDNEYDNLWILNHNEDIKDDSNPKVEYKIDNEETQVIPCIKFKPCTYVGRTPISFQNVYSQSVIDELKKQLESCRQLLALEPDSKWTLLTTTVFLHCVDVKLYHKEVISNLRLLKSIDKLRSGYYDHLISKWCMEEQLCEDYSRDSMDLKLSSDEKLTSLPHLQYYSYCENVDLSNQELTARTLPSLAVLTNCKKLSLENNQLKSLEGFPSLQLEEINLKGNKDLDKNELETFKKRCNAKIIC